MPEESAAQQAEREARERMTPEERAGHDTAWMHYGEGTSRYDHLPEDWQAYLAMALLADWQAEGLSDDGVRPHVDFSKWRDFRHQYTKTADQIEVEERRAGRMVPFNG